MPKNNAEMERAKMARRRQKARAAGLCGICCKKAPNPGRTICASCNAAKAERKRRKRKKDREVTQFRYLIVAHERTGDLAREHRLYEDAVQYYQDALSVKTIDSNERMRISEKLAHALSLSANPQAAAPFFDNVLNSYLREPTHAEKTIELLLQLARQRWLDSHTEDALPFIAQAVRIADVSGMPKLRTLTRTRMTNYLLGLNRFEEAKDVLQSCGDTLLEEEPTIVSMFSMQKAIIAGAYGEKEQALVYFEQAITTAKDDPDPYQRVAVRDAQSIWMLALGETKIAKTSGERALELARREHIPWLIQRQCIGYADILFLLGEYEKAHDYLVQALAYDTDVPHVTGALSSAGLLIALQARDTAAISYMTRSFDPEVLFKTANPAEIAAQMTVFPHWHIMEGRDVEAEKLLHRAVSVLSPTKFFADIWSFPITVARYGALEDLRPARRIIEARITLPTASVAQATLGLFDAYVAKREGRYRKALRCAKDATQRFEMLGWYSYVDLAKTLVFSLLEIKPEDKGEALGPAQVLTLREREVAEWLRKGLTNREIAEMLSISLHTVHTHVASIMTRLGLHSRHQLVNVLPDTKP